LLKFSAHIGYLFTERPLVDFMAIMNALAEIGYDDCIAAEYLPAGRTEDGLGWMKALLALR
jgi:hydroxypyruvate isomerase